ncbi:MAG: M23 family metallopeptidase [Anaerolineales bacterium]|nr:M23 family metallopeptidase [Anaerolineales bacterium]
MSKLGPHYIGAPGLEKWIAAGAKVFKFDPTGLGASHQVPPGPLVVGKLDQEDAAINLTDWKALMNRGVTPQAAADLRFSAQRNVYAGANRPRVDRYLANPRVDVWEDDNEVVPDTSDEARWYAAYCIAMMGLYDSIGRKRANFSFAVGTPDIRPGHARDIWPHLLPAVRHARDNGHYIALHEYMGFEADLGVGWKQIDANRRPLRVWHGRKQADGRPDESYPYGWTVLRYRLIYDTYFAPAGLGDVKLLITELGCDSVESVTPAGMPVGTWREHAPHWRAGGREPEQVYADMLQWYDARIGEDPFVAGAMVFTVGSVGVWAKWDIAGTDVESRLLEHVRYSAAEEPPPTLPPPAPPPTASGNLLPNPSWEGVWKDSDEWPMTTQDPKGWLTLWNVTRGDEYKNPFAPDQPYGVGEAIHKFRSQIPDDEEEDFFGSGDVTYKIFANHCFWVRMKTAVDLEPGRYMLGTPVFTDTFRWHGSKDYNVEADQTQIMVKVDGKIARNWTALPPGRLVDTTTTFEHPGGEAELAIHLRCNWAISNNLWPHDWSLVRVQENQPEPPQPQPEPARHKAVVLKLPQDMSGVEWLAAAEYCYPYRHTMTASHDDMLTVLCGGNEQSYAKVMYPSRQPDTIKALEAAGYRWESVLDDPPLLPSVKFDVWPVDGARMVTQAFGARPEVYAQYGFPGHEGIDLRATLNAPVRAVTGGSVSRITTTGNYGNRIDITHDGGWVTTYAHLNKFAGLKVGDAVTSGQLIGYAGTTGNSTGVHLHFGLKCPWHSYIDSNGTQWPFNIFDPTPYLDKVPSLPNPPAAIDLLPYLRGTHRRQFDMGYNGGTQTTQVWHLSNKDWLFVKGENGEYERLGLRTWNGQEWIFRFEDTSETPTRFYAHYLSKGGPIGAPWFPRLAEIGKWYETSKYVQHYLKAGCVAQNGGDVTDRLRLVSGPRTVTYSESGVKLDSVITLEWAAGEQYDFALGRGNVAFRDGGRRFWFIGDLEGRADKPFKKPGCIQMGW